MTDVVVTGAGGFAGGAILRALRAQGRSVVGLTRADGDLRDQRTVEALLAEHRPEAVVHAAGRVGGIAANVAAPVAFFAENVELGLAVVRGARAAGVSTLLNLSSSCVYPRDLGILREEDLDGGALEPTNEGYALAKLAIGRLCAWIAAEDAACAYRTLLPCNLYGPGDHFETSRSHLVAAAIRKACEAAEHGDASMTVWGDGSARREFMHVDDLAAAVCALIDRAGELPQDLNVGVGDDASVDEYYAAAARAAGWTGELVHDESRPAGMDRKLLDVSRIERLGWRAQVSLDDGMAETVAWFREHVAPGLAA